MTQRDPLKDPQPGDWIATWVDASILVISVDGGVVEYMDSFGDTEFVSLEKWADLCRKIHAEVLYVAGT